MARKRKDTRPNHRIVRIRADRECADCSTTIPKGSEAFTFFEYNHRGEPLPFRSWRCLPCHKDRQEEQEHQQIMDECERGWDAHKIW